MVIMDVNFHGEDPNISPPWKFLEADFLKKLISLSQDHIFVAINVLCYSDESRKRLEETLK